MAVVSADGEKVGEVGDISIAADSGTLTRVTLKRGMLFKHETEIPVAWVRDLGHEGVLLNVLKAEVEALDAGSKND
jgi:sporulation protein YlmC with PRC-barrel domain